MRAVLVAGTTSGVGKTVIAAGLMALLRSKGYSVQPFKAGPDYIDPSYHTWAAGETSRNLDSWLLEPDAVLELFLRVAKGKDIAVIEGVMGLYDGRSSITEEGSTAELAKLLGIPVLLVVDSRKGARSFAAMVKGYRDFDPGLDLAGVILNSIGSDGHLRLCREAIEYYTGLPVLGYLRRSEELMLPERHLGLVPVVERPAGDQFLDRLVAGCGATFDIPEILRISERVTVSQNPGKLFPPKNLSSMARIGVARDRAFSFYYQDSLDLLEAWGAELVYFSPIADSALPVSVSGLYIGGGFPELYSRELAANNSMKRSIRDAADDGMPIYAECGGLMYMGQSILDLEGKEHAMVGFLPFRSRLDAPRLNLGYRTVEAVSDGPLLRRGVIVRGHEFHWSVPCGDSDGSMNAYRIAGSDAREGFQVGNTFASYIHLHMASRPGMARRFIEHCCQYGERQSTP